MYTDCVWLSRKNFAVLQNGIDVKPFFVEVEPYLDFLNKKDNYELKPLVKSSKLVLIGRDYPESSKIHTDPRYNTYHGQDMQVTRVGQHFPYTLKFLSEFAMSRGEVLSQVVIRSLVSRGDITRHFDFGGYHILRKRFHLVIKSEGCLMRVGGEEQTFHQGELFYFNNRQPHESYNLGDSLRIHIIFDTLPRSFLRRTIMLFLWFLHERKLYARKRKDGLTNDWSPYFWKSYIFGQQVVNPDSWVRYVGKY